MEFFNSDTKEQLDWNQVWGKIRPVSPLGRSRHSKYTAFLPTETAKLQEELDRVEHICQAWQENPASSQELIYFLENVRDVSASLRRAGSGLTLDDTELYEIKKLLFLLQKIQGELNLLRWEHLLPVSLDLCTPCRQVLSVGQGPRESFYLADAYDEELSSVRKKRIFLERKLAEFKSKAEEKVVTATGRIFSMEDEIAVSTVDQAVILKLEKVQELQKTEVTGEFVKFRLAENETSKRQREQLQEFQEKEEACKTRVRQKISAVVGEYSERLLEMQELLGFLDLLLAKAKFCAGFKGIKPVLSTHSIFRIQEGRHLLVEEEVALAGYDYTPLDICLKAGVTVITGPNMGGKTVGLKTIGLLAAMAQFGLLVPAKAMEFQPLWFVAAHLAHAEIPQGLSTFAGEIIFLQKAVEKSGHVGLILVDEIAHGTNPAEGAAIAGAVVETLQTQPALTVITTHYPSLARRKGLRQLRVKGLDKKGLEHKQKDAFRRCMDYRLEAADPAKPLFSDAAVVAEAMGLDGKIIARAKEMLAKGWEDGRHD